MTSRLANVGLIPGLWKGARKNAETLAPGWLPSAARTNMAQGVPILFLLSLSLKFSNTY